MNKRLIALESPDFFLAELDRIAAEEGDEVYVLSHQGRHDGRDRVLRIDARADHEGALREITDRVGRPDAVLTTQEMFLTQAAALADAFGVSRDPLASVAASRDKARMKDAWLAAGVRTPQGRFYGTAADLDSADRFAYPVIAKPSMGFASCGVRKVDSAAELTEHLRKIFLVNSTVVAKERLRGAGFLVEEYVEGPEFSIDTIWYDGEPLCDAILSKGTATGPYFPDRLYYLDPRLPEETARKIEDLSHRAVRALGIGHGATHTEIRFRGDEPFVLETTNRPGAGGLFYTLFKSALGIDFHRLYYLAAVCDSADELAERAGTWKPYDLRPDTYPFWYNMPHQGHGVLKEIRGLAELTARPEIDLCLCYKQPGAVLYPEGLDADYFCSLLGTYRDAEGAPPIEEFITGYDTALEVIF
ncbi:ATP-grasp domain-containing protein [Streptomyces sp. NPDC047046]|uniref:ATP-grasp domain-containing protein n=1 Tax=Streptomyces sp. NPDC047046 TaxID=3155378 RepID=UPI0033C3EFD8